MFRGEQIVKYQCPFSGHGTFMMGGVRRKRKSPAGTGLLEEINSE